MKESRGFMQEETTRRLIEEEDESKVCRISILVSGGALEGGKGV